MGNRNIVHGIDGEHACAGMLRSSIGDEQDDVKDGEPDRDSEEAGVVVAEGFYDGPLEETSG